MHHNMAATVLTDGHKDMLLKLTLMLGLSWIVNFISIIAKVFKKIGIKIEKDTSKKRM